MLFLLLAPRHTPPTMVSSSFGELDTLLETTGVLAGSVALWEIAVSPALKKRGLLPDRPLVPGHLTEDQKSVQWLTPLTCDDKVPLPPLDELRTRDHCVGKVGDVHQFITITTCRRRRPRLLQPQLQLQLQRQGQMSPEFSDCYGTTVYIYKRPVIYSRTDDM
jgi:hypothetical protein